jgi:hypothetical protein
MILATAFLVCANAQSTVTAASTFTATVYTTTIPVDINATVNNTLSNPLVANYIIGNPAVEDCFINYPNQTVAILTDQYMIGIDSNPNLFIAFLENPSFCELAENFQNFTGLLNSGVIRPIEGNATEFQTLLSNPSLGVIINNTYGFSTVVAGPASSTLRSNPMLFNALLSNPSLGSMGGSATQINNLITSPSYAPLVNNKAATASLLSNPSLTSIISSPYFGGFVTGGALSHLDTSSQFVTFMSNPAFITFVNGPAFGMVSSNQAPLYLLITNPSLSLITGNPMQLASLLSNPSLGSIIANPSGIASLASGGSFTTISGNPTAFSNLLSNPALAGINSNPAQFTAFLGTNAFSLLKLNPSIFDVLFGNPALGIVIANPAGLSGLLSNSSIGQAAIFPSVLTSIFGSNAITALSANPGALGTILGSTSFSTALANPAELNAFINNPSIATILGSPGQFTGFLSSTTVTAISGNPAQFKALLGNPSLGAVMGSPAGLQTILTTPSISAAASNDPQLVPGILANPSLGSLAANPAQLSPFITNPSLINITSNAFMLGGILANPSLTSMIASPSQLAAFAASFSFNAMLATNPAALSNLLANPSLTPIIANPTTFNVFLGNQPISSAIDTPAQLASLMSNPSLFGMVGNLASFKNLMNNQSLASALYSGSLTSLLSNPSLSSIISSPSQSAALEYLLGSPSTSGIYDNSTFDSLMGNPTALPALLSNPNLVGVLSNPETSLMLTNPSVVNNPNAAGILSNPSLLLMLDEPTTSALLANLALSGFTGSSGAGSTLGNAQAPYLFYQAGSLLFQPSGGSSGINPGTGNSGCSAGTSNPTGGFCILTAAVQDTTNSGGQGGSISAQSTGTAQSTPLIRDVLSKNANNADWLITCPNTPGPSTTLYLSANATGNHFVDGNRCLASITPILTVITLTTYIVWTPVTPAVATQTYTVTGLASGFTEDLAYSGLTGTSDNKNFTLSSGYDTESYIFNQVPSAPQSGLWTWASDIANLQQTDTSQLVSSTTLSQLQLDIPGLFIATYDYNVNSSVVAVNNLNISVPAMNASALLAAGSYLRLGGYTYSPAKEVSSGYNGLSTGTQCCGWVKISENGSASASSGTYKGTLLNVYIGRSGNASNPSATYPITLLAAGANGLLIEADAATAINSLNVSQVPYLVYKSSIPSAYTQLSSKPIFYNSSYNLYGVHNYVDPANYLEPFPLSTTPGFFGTYFGYLSVFPIGLVSLPGHTSTSDGYLANPQNNILSMLTPQQASQVNQGQPVGGITTRLGRYTTWSIQNPLFIAAAPNGYIYVINSSTNNCPHWWSLCIGSSTKSFLFVMRYIPTGDVNLTNDQPTLMKSTTSQSAWTKEWKGYYANSILEGSQNLYITNVYEMTSTYSSWITGTSSNGGLVNQLVPLAIATDNNADVFALGAHLSIAGGGAQTPTTSFQLAGILGNGAKISTTVTRPQSTGKFPFIPSDEFAAAPGGEYVYVANASYWNGEIEVYSTGTGSSNTPANAPSGALIAPAPSASSTSISSGSSVTLTASPTGGATPYSIQWYTGTAATCSSDSLVADATSTTFTDSPTTSNTYCYQVTDSDVPPNSVYSATTQITIGTQSTGTCPDSDSPLTLSFSQIAACAQAAGFSGTSLIQMISIAYAESSGSSSVTVPGINAGDPNCVVMGILQEGLCDGSNGESYPLSNPSYSPSTCTAYQQNPTWTSIWYDPKCAFAWAYAFTSQNPPITQTSPSPGCTQAVGDTPYCFWGTYWLGGSYCKFAPTSYSGYNCPQGLNQANLPWSSIGVQSNGGSNGGTGGTSSPLPSTSQTANTFSYAGNIPLSYSNATSILNITAYLASGGPYADPAVASAYKGLAPTNDISAFHHPVSIVDSKGILYVIDNWTIYVDSMQSTIMMLRAFAENGSEIPINPSTVNTSLASNSQIPGLVHSKGEGVTPANGWRPFGWPLSANITVSSGNTISYCILECTYAPGNFVQYHTAADPASFNTLSYLPIGPRMSSTSTTSGPWNSIAISADFNGTLYIIAHPYSYTTSNGCTWGSWFQSIISSGSQPACIPQEVPNAPLYTELLVLHPVIQNYTKISLAENTSYICYLNQLVPSPVGWPCINSPVTYNDLGNLYAPILGVPSSFSYVESLGNPEQYLNLPNAYSAAFPTGIDNSKYSSGASQLASNGISNPNYGTLATTSPTGGTVVVSNTPNTYLKSSIAGYVITPYNITLKLKQSYTLDSCTPEIEPAGAVACAALATVGLLSNLGLTNGQTSHYNYATTQLTPQTGPLSTSASVNTTIEGGGTYPQYLPGQTNYIPNLSDAGLIISPYINFQIFTNRLFGEVYVNQTISPKTAQTVPTNQNPVTTSGTLPVVVNASNNYKYSETNYVQSSLLGGSVSGINGNPAFTVQIATPLTNPTVGVNCGSSCPSNYYYNPSRAYSGSSNIIYNHTVPAIPQVFQLAELFKISTYLDNLVLDFRSPQSGVAPSSLLGYNRLVYTYVDRFNNTIDMPVDVDFANITQLSLSTSEVISPTNTNQTTITVNGLAVYSSPGGPVPVPSGTPIYLYYDTNINYLNATSCPTGSSCTTTNDIGYYQNAMICAFAPSTKSCTLANPLSTLTQPQPVGAQEANTIAFHTNTNSSGACGPQPNSLLLLPSYSCNIYGSDGVTNNIPTVQYDQYANNSKGGYQYCLPIFNNGTGIFTTQLGLVNITKTDQNGNFSDSFTACGTGVHRVIAYYYGANAPEPIIADQSPLSSSAGASEFFSTSVASVKSSEFNYTYSPDATTTQFSIGSYALSMGAISLIGLTIALGASVLIILAMRNRAKPKRKKVNG